MDNSARITLAEKSARQKISEMSEIRELGDDELDEHKILRSGMKNKQVLNAFRDLRTQLMQKAEGGNFTCLVSSLCENGGGSFVSTNLAAVIALDKTKTSLLIDCNLYDPSVERLLGVSVDHGITDYLDESDLGIQHIIYASGVKRMRVVPIGSNRERGAEHFSSEKMAAFIQSVSARYSDRFIILDAPPILTSAETKILADLCDIVVLVVPYGRVTEQQIQSGISKIAKEKLAGVVFNN